MAIAYYLIEYAIKNAQETDRCLPFSPPKKLNIKKNECLKIKMRQTSFVFEKFDKGFDQ